MMTLPQREVCRCIKMSMVELTAITSTLECAAPNKRSALIEPDNSNGLKPSLSIYHLSFRYPDSPNMLSEEGRTKLSDLQDCWNRFFSVLSSLCADRGQIKDAEKKQHVVHEACSEALSGRHASDEEKLFDDFCESLTALSRFVAEATADAVKSRTRKNTTPKKVRAKAGELTQADVAKDFGVKRKTVIRWESKQTEDGPSNKSNPYGYYQRLRLDPNLRRAYDELVRVVKPYLAARAEAKRKGIRFRVTFERFNEKFAEHNKKE